ncbi:hypothetical protein RFI_22740 [Reticulomyxa filosa]|uniref:COMM domain-containing protein n=1 Tax=Reticulomyxa filosa TaxID=46433 RepID=X6MKT7_RETFI|nr:hypothetical protein RFI_22740 [Reticulomyxa filosa]|eukprot:ETO14628.1 hypothetical protein RFI_22740 [Reticulomyxa filosa]
MDLLEKIEERTLERYLHSVVDGYLGRNVGYLTDLDVLGPKKAEKEAESEANSVRIKKQLKELPNPSHSHLALQLVRIFEHCLSSTQQATKKSSTTVNAVKITLKELNEALPDIGLSDETVFNKIYDVIEIRKAELMNEAKKRSICVGLPSYLLDFDWSLRLILSSSHLSNTRIPVCLLTLSIKDTEANDHSKSRSGIRTVNIQLNQSELNQFIAQLKHAKSVASALQKHTL